MCCMHLEQELMNATIAVSLALIGQSMLAAAHGKPWPALRGFLKAKGTQLHR